MPKASLLLFFLLFNSLCVTAQSARLKYYCNQLNRLNTQVCNGAVTKKSAVKDFQTLIQKIKKESKFISNNNWVFPLAGYNANAIGGYKGDGYNDKGYNYLDGNKHTAHPAHDIFIKDQDQDYLDDGTKKPVDVVAVTDGVVLACTNAWTANSSLRGGKYIWLYHPQLHIITYYAHNRNVFVVPGNVVKQGQKIAEVGRTGFNASKQRSPTHLHFSAFKFVNWLPVPFNPYLNLTKAITL
jgi:hypothetical protein